MIGLPIPPDPNLIMNDFDFAMASISSENDLGLEMEVKDGRSRNPAS